MSASCSSAPEASKIPPDHGQLFGEIDEALLEGDDEHGVPFWSPRCARGRCRIAGTLRGPEVDDGPELVVVKSAMVREDIRGAVAADGEALARIYNPYVAATTVTFEETPVTGAEMAARLAAVVEAGLPWLVAEADGAVVGYAYASPWKSRCAYRLSVEATVYLESAHQGRGWGTRLYERLFARLTERGIHSVVAGIALPNEASVALHEKLGMRKVAHFPEIGFKLGRWIDVGYWQRSF
jgi:L-amino acid N-acyltransferase YncA